MAKKISNIAETSVKKDPQAAMLLRMFDKMSKRPNWDSMWGEVGRYIAPDKNYVFERKANVGTKGEERHNRLYDGTAEHSAGLLASALHTLLSSPTQQFFGVTTGEPLIDEIPRVGRYIQNVVDLGHEILAASNFQSEIHETYKDIITFGTNVLRMDDDDEDLIRFFSMPIFEHYLAENHKGIVNVVAKSFKMPVRHAFAKYGMEKFGIEAKKLGKDIDKEIVIIQITMDRETAKMRALDNLDRPFVTFHVYKESQIILQEKGHFEFPFAVPRWEKTTGEIYGRSPGTKALPDVRMVNQMMRVVIRAAQKAVDPPLAILDDGVIGRVNLRPGGLTSVRSSGRDQRVIEPLISGARPDIGLDMVNEARTQIRKAFFADQLQLPQIDRQTATESTIRNEDRIRLLGPLLGRTNIELLSPIITNLIGKMGRRGRLPENIPPELVGRPLNVFFKSQIAKAQKMIEANNHNQWLASIAPVADRDPTVLDMLDGPKFVRKMGNLHGIDKDLLKTDKELARIAEQRQANEQQQQEVEQTVAISEAVKNTAGVLPLQAGI